MAACHISRVFPRMFYVAPSPHLMSGFGPVAAPFRCSLGVLMYQTLHDAHGSRAITAAKHRVMIEVMIQFV